MRARLATAVLAALCAAPVAAQQPAASKQAAPAQQPAPAAVPSTGFLAGPFAIEIDAQRAARGGYTTLTPQKVVGYFVDQAVNDKGERGVAFLPCAGKNLPLQGLQRIARDANPAAARAQVGTERCAFAPARRFKGGDVVLVGDRASAQAADPPSFEHLAILAENPAKGRQDLILLQPQEVVSAERIATREALATAIAESKPGWERVEAGRVPYNQALLESERARVKALTQFRATLNTGTKTQCGEVIDVDSAKVEARLRTRSGERTLPLWVLYPPESFKSEEEAKRSCVVETPKQTPSDKLYEEMKKRREAAAKQEAAKPSVPGKAATPPPAKP